MMHLKVIRRCWAFKYNKNWHFKEWRLWKKWKKCRWRQQYTYVAILVRKNLSLKRDKTPPYQTSHHEWLFNVFSSTVINGKMWENSVIYNKYYIRSTPSQNIFFISIVCLSLEIPISFKSTTILSPEEF